MESPGLSRGIGVNPTNHAGAPHAQYYIFDGSHYLANVIENQEWLSGWQPLGQWSGFNSNPRITLSDKDAGGISEWNIAAAAARITCFQP